MFVRCKPHIRRKHTNYDIKMQSVFKNTMNYSLLLSNFTPVGLKGFFSGFNDYVGNKIYLYIIILKSPFLCSS